MDADRATSPASGTPAAGDGALVLACRHTDATTAMITGAVTPTGVPIRIVAKNNVVDLFAGMLRGEYDISEMSMAEFIYYRSRGAANYIGIPVFPSRVFRHGYIYCNKDAGITTPDLLSGKKLGFLRWVQTAFVWIRGTLVDDYGVSGAATNWYVNSLHHWQDGKEERVFPRDGSTIRHLPERAGMPEYDRLCSALIDGELDAIAVTENTRYFDLLSRSEKVCRLFPHPRREEAAYYKRKKIFPIMHLLVVREDALAKHPELGQHLFTLFSRSKKVGRKWFRATPSLMLAWKDQYLDEEADILGDDPCPFGMKENEFTLATFLRYCHEQGISSAPMEVRDLFARETWDLHE